MLKLLGVIIILFGTTALGMYKAYVYLNRLNNLNEIKKAFLYIQGEVRYMNTPLPETLETVAARVRGPLQVFFQNVAMGLNGKNGRDFKGIWEERFLEDVSADMLEREAGEELLQMGGQLGCLDRKAQEKAIDYFLKKWEFITERRQKEKNNRLRLYYVCGIMGGLLMVIILV